jgi:hypothetical protein
VLLDHAKGICIALFKFPSSLARPLLPGGWLSLAPGLKRFQFVQSLIEMSVQVQSRDGRPSVWGAAGQPKRHYRLSLQSDNGFLLTNEQRYDRSALAGHPERPPCPEISAGPPNGQQDKASESRGDCQWIDWSN